MAHLSMTRAGYLGALLLLGGCSGAGFYQRTDYEAGSSIVYDQAVFRAVERIIAVCGVPILEPRDDRFRGEAFFLRGCGNPNGATDLTALVEGQPQPERLQNLARVLGLIDEPLPAPIPEALPGFEVRRDVRLLSWLLPAFERGINDLDLPESGRAVVLATIRPLLESAQCEFVAHVGIDLLPLRLTGLRLSWERVQGAAILRLHTGFPEAAPEARAQITSSINCGGSNRNAAHNLLKQFFPDGPHDVNLAAANLTVDYQIAVAPPMAGQTTNFLLVTLRNVTFATTRVDVQPFGNPIGDSVLSDALKEANVTPLGVAARAQQQLRPALRPLGDRLAQILEDSLDLEATPDRPAREVVGVEAEPSGIANETQIRFEARRTDTVCFNIPRIGWVCRDPPPDQTCFTLPRHFEMTCIPRIRPRLP